MYVQRQQQRYLLLLHFVLVCVTDPAAATITSLPMAVTVTGPEKLQETPVILITKVLWPGNSKSHSGPAASPGKRGRSTSPFGSDNQGGGGYGYGAFSGGAKSYASFGVGPPNLNNQAKSQGQVSGGGFTQIWGKSTKTGGKSNKSGGSGKSGGSQQNHEYYGPSRASMSSHDEDGQVQWVPAYANRRRSQSPVNSYAASTDSRKKKGRVPSVSPPKRDGSLSPQGSTNIKRW